MNSSKINIEIKKLKKSLNNDKINTLDAIDKFIKLLNSFQHDNDFNSDEENTLYKRTWSNISKQLHNENRTLHARADKLNRILVLLELGVRFSDNELKQILQASN